MNWVNFWWFLLLYGVSFVPYFVVGYIKNGGIKALLMFVDFILSCAGLAFLWYAMPNTWASAATVGGVVWVSIVCGRLARAHGYDPYGVEVMNAKRRAEQNERRAVKQEWS